MRDYRALLNSAQPHPAQLLPGGRAARLETLFSARAPSWLALLALLSACGSEEGNSGDASSGASSNDGGGMPSEECPSDDEWGKAAADFEARVVELVNERRAAGASCGGEAFAAAEPLTMEPVLQCAARLHSADMVENNYFDHQSKDGRSPFERMEDLGYTGFPSAENIAGGSATPEAVVDQWMESPGHCSNIMNPDYDEIGVGYVAGGEFGSTWTQTFGSR